MELFWTIVRILFTVFVISRIIIDWRKISNLEDQVSKNSEYREESENKETHDRIYKLTKEMHDLWYTFVKFQQSLKPHVRVDYNNSHVKTIWYEDYKDYYKQLRDLYNTTRLMITPEKPKRKYAKRKNK